MKKLMRWMVALAALPLGAFQGQNLTGNWQGTIEAGPQKLRVVFEMSVQDDKLKATFHSIDQPAAPAMPANSVTRDGSTVKIALGGVATYEGKLSADGNSMTGTWTQGAALPLNLVRATPETAWTIPEPPPPPKPMDAKADPEFAVATIKPSDPAQAGQVVYASRSGRGDHQHDAERSGHHGLRFARQADYRWTGVDGLGQV